MRFLIDPRHICSMMRPGGTMGASSRKAASDKYADELKRSGWTLMPVAKRDLHVVALLESEVPNHTVGNRAPRIDRT